MESKPTNDIKFAIYGCPEEITDEMYQEVLDFAEYARKKSEKEKTAPVLAH